MDTYIGLGAHASSCTLGVLGPGGKRLGSHVVETNAKALIEVLRKACDLGSKTVEPRQADRRVCLRRACD